MNTPQTEHNEHSLRGGVMDAIQKGRIAMRPRWHFVLFSAFGVVGALLVFLTLLYTVSLGVFFLRESGALFAPSFGMRGWFVLLRELPWVLIALMLLFIALLRALVHRYRFVYGKPLIVSLVSILAIVVLGGFAIAQTSLHPRLFLDARRGHLPPPVNMLYGPRFRPPRGGEVFHGRIVRMFDGGFVVVSIEGDSTSTVFITPHTRLPYGGDFSSGDTVVVVGDPTATGTIRAFGIREVAE